MPKTPVRPIVVCALGFLCLLVAVGPATALDVLVFVRHAEKETPWPREVGTYQPLSEAGRERAANLATSLEGLGIAAVVSSPTSRTVTTGAAVAKALGVPIGTDPRLIESPALGAFFDDLRQRHANDRAVLVVAHSNTIPELLRHLGADDGCAEALGFGFEEHGGRQIEVIEGYDGIWLVDLGQPGCAGMERRAQTPPASAAVGSETPEAPIALLATDRLSLGEARYTLRHGREPMGLVRVTTRRDGEALVVVEELSISRARIERRSEVRYTDATARRVQRLRTTGSVGPSTADIALDLVDDRLQGHSDYPRSRSKPRGRLAIDRQVTGNLFTDAGLPALAPALPIFQISDFALAFYDPTDDEASVLSVRVGPAGEQSSPDGVVEAVPVTLTGDGSVRRLWITTEPPHRTVRLELEDRGWVYELVGWEPASTSSPAEQ